MRDKRFQPSSRSVPSRTVIIDASGVVHPVPTSNPSRQASHGDRMKVIKQVKESK